MYQVMVKGPKECVAELKAHFSSWNWAATPMDSLDAAIGALLIHEPDEKQLTRMLEALSTYLDNHEYKRLGNRIEVHPCNLDRAEPVSGSPLFSEPFQPTPGLTICPWASGRPLKSCRRPRPPENTIYLDPGSSFGSGKHPSTCLCLTLLNQMATLPSRYPGFSQDRILDMGCGTGILSLAAAKMGAREVIGLEIDPSAADTATANVKRNGMTSRVTVYHGSWEQVRRQTFYLIMANLTASVLFSSGGKIGDHLDRWGFAMVSGFQEPQVDSVHGFLQKQGLVMHKTLTQRGWAAFLMQKSV